MKKYNYFYNQINKSWKIIKIKKILIVLVIKIKVITL